ncbi:peptidoglycan-binding protein [Micromonospora azadirachtae]|uniref:Peptidoglycan-binding protein n=1 Tax=Micromonospora azadirachtae TaxID=1970735 RepID=A0ABW2ZY24_9ACTN
MIVSIAVVLGVAVVGGISALEHVLRTPGQAAADAAPPDASLVTALVERRVLGEPILVRGNITPGPSTKLLPPIGATGPEAVVTRVRVRNGQTLEEGDPILDIAGQPLIPLDLPFPLYRDLAPGLAGPDVEAVQVALRRLGYHPTKDGKVDTTTAREIRRFLADRGYSSPSAEAGTKPPVTPSADPQGATSAGLGSAENAVVLPRSLVLRVTKQKSKVTAVRAKVGAVLSAPDTVLLELDGTGPFIALSLTVDKATQLRVGQPASALDEESGKRVQVQVQAIGTKVGVDSVTGSSGVPVTLSFKGAPMAANDRSLLVEIPSEQDGDPVLAVPVSAVYSKPDGSSFVTVVMADGSTEDVAISADQAIGGWVKIQGDASDALSEGSRVVVGLQ